MSIHDLVRLAPYSLNMYRRVMSETPTDEFDLDGLVLLCEADIARREYEQERREMFAAEAEEREMVEQIRHMRRTGQDLPEWALHFIACYGQV